VLKKTLLIVSLTLVISLTLVLSAACSNNPPTSNSSNTSTSTSSQTATSSTAIQPIVLRLAPGGSNPPPAGGLTTAVNEFANIIQKRTNGRVKVEIYWTQTLVSENNIVTALQNGTADIGQISSHKETGKVPLSMVGQLPGIGTDLWARISAFYELGNQDPEKSELAKYNIKTISSIGMTDQMIISKNPIRSLSDLKGKKVAAAGIAAEEITALGAVPVTMSPPDQYTGMDKGTIDAISTPIAAIYDFKFYEVSKYLTYLPCGPRVYIIGMNQDKWNSLPADLQKIFSDSVPDFVTAATDAYINTNKESLKVLQDKKFEFINLSDSDMATVAQIQAAQADKWATGIGDPGKKILGDFRTLVEKYEKISPYKK
jgi:TRAP-type transport system periplasmic protein